MVESTRPLPTAPALVLEARRKIAQAKRQRLYAREALFGRNLHADVQPVIHCVVCMYACVCMLCVCACMRVYLCCVFVFVCVCVCVCVT